MRMPRRVEFYRDVYRVDPVDGCEAFDVGRTMKARVWLGWVGFRIPIRLANWLEGLDPRHQHVYGGGRLHAIDRKLNELLKQGEKIMARNEEFRTFLADLKTYTDNQAAAEEEQTALIVEIKDGMDALLADKELPDDIKEEMQALREKAAAAAASSAAQTETLKGIAASDDEPLPEPVEPEPTDGQ